ncbi:hypothetical protein EMCG_00522 [[Emmonsia] crescens]|uniref:Uncharacterized protein n=1 Tax=[Emmonsia] crescens TaxID=73230 RepID=A0A0G2HVK4_9EURO|nr:hypothetical protein EMCG_00522 [Emmonsia crescens UAMH 3008]
MGVGRNLTSDGRNNGPEKCMHATRDGPLHTIFDLHSKVHARGLSINLYRIRREIAFQETLMKRTETAVCHGKLQEDWTSTDHHKVFRDKCSSVHEWR